MEVDWSKAPEWATHALTTGSKWSALSSTTGEIRFARYDDGRYYYGQDEELYYTICDKHWIVLEERPEESADMVNHPPHYQSDNGIECIDAIRAALGKEGFIAYCRGNAIKYTWRDKKDNKEDYNKACWYLNRAAVEAGNDE
jgi:hypothetical protein